MKPQSRATPRELIGDFIASHSSMSRDPKETLKAFVMQQIMMYQPHAYRVIFKMYKRGENYQHTEEKVCIHS